MEPLWRTVYTSQCARPWQASELDELEQFCRRRNRERAVTGLLLFDGTSFIQLLEGPEVMVRVTMERIEQDRRHCALHVSMDQAAPTRQFARWAMRCRRVPNDAAMAELTKLLMVELSDVTEGPVRALFLQFARTSAERAWRLDAGRAPTSSAEERAMAAHLDLLMEQAQEALDRTEAVRRLADDAARLDSVTRQQFRLN